MLCYIHLCSSFSIFTVQMCQPKNLNYIQATTKVEDPRPNTSVTIKLTSLRQLPITLPCLYKACVREGGEHVGRKTTRKRQ